MKRKKFIKHLKSKGVNYFVKEAIIQFMLIPKQSAVGRHSELSDLLCKKVCKQLGIDLIK